MRIEKIALSEFKEFLNSDLYLNSNQIPITLHRALSQLQNPRANDSDIVLLVAYNENSELAGFVGALPDKIKGKLKVAWNSCWYSDRNLGKTVALPLFLTFIKEWENKILMRDLTDHTKTIIQNLRFFQKIKTENRKRFFTLFYFHDLILNKRPAFRMVSIPLKFIDYILNSFTFSIQAFWKRRHGINKLISKEIVDKIDEETQKFIRAKNGNELIQRDKKELEWIINNPWIVQSTEENNSLSGKYYFSSVAKSFHYYPIKIFRLKELIGFFLIKERDHHFEIPYVYFEEEYLFDIAVSCIHFLMSKKCRSLTIANRKVRQILEKVKYPYIYSRTYEQEFFVSNELVREIGNDFELQDGDGDAVFT